MWCPGCKMLHQVNVDKSRKPCWEWDGNREYPTFSPSIKVKGVDRKGGGICHSFLKKGVWQFLNDCTHELAGQHVEMVEIPND